MKMYDFSIEVNGDDVSFISNYGDEICISLSIDQIPAVVRYLNTILEERE